MGLTAGVFLGFSDFIMRGLAMARDTQGAAGMIGLNRTVYRSLFMVLLMGLVPVSIGLLAAAIWLIDGLAAAMIAAGALSYLLGVFAVTGIGNVPMNNRLDAIEHRANELAAYWPDYARRWTQLNHVRVAAAAIAALCWLSAAQLI